MNKMNIIFFTVAIFLSAQVCAFEFITIDTFATAQNPLVKIISAGATSDYDWWTIYQSDVNYAGPPDFAFHDTSDCLGGQRDLLLGHEGSTPVGSVSILSIVNNRATVAFPLNYAGGAYYQWDGDDAAGGTSAFPGANLSTTPGIGSLSEIPEANGQSVDFTSGGNGIGIGISISSDLPVRYFIDARDSLGNANELGFDNNPSSEDSVIRYFFRYTDSRWTNLAFNWADVAAFQVRVFTFTGGATQAIDTDFFAIGVIGYIISGNVFIDCGCVGTPLSFVNNEQIDLHLGATPNNLIESAFTDINGDFSFTGLDEGTYTVCLNNLAQDLCQPISGCTTVVLANEIDVTDIEFSITTLSTLVAPPDITIECGDCQTVACLGSATATLCGSGSVPVTTFTDSPTVGGCTQTFQRTFSDNGVFATQTVTIQDTTNPVVVTPAQAISRNCDDSVSLSYSAWLAVDGNAVFDDCSSFSVTNNAGPDPGICGSQNVVFTATDICGNLMTSSASYTVNDFIAPTFNTAPQSASADCDAAGNSDFNAFNTWLATNAGASATDNCGGVSITNDFIQGSLVRGCNSAVIVTYTATDTCSNSISATASFTIIDQSGPVIAPQAQSPTVTCDANAATAFNTWLNNFGNAGASDDCVDSQDLFFSNDFVGSPPFGCDDSRTVTFTVSDSCGQSASTTGTFTVVDSSNPTLTSPAQPLNVDCDNSNGTELNTWLASNGGATATDDCGGVSFTNDFVSLSGDCTAVPVTFTGCDICGNCIATTSTYSIVDTEAPSFSVLPSDLIVECGSDTQTAYDSWVASNGNSVVFDNCATVNELSFFNDAPSSPSIGNGCSSPTPVNFRVQDPCGNTSPVASASFIVNDSIAPSFTSFPIDETVDCNPSTNNQDYTSWLASRAGADAIDSCTTVVFSNDGASSFSLANGDCFDSTTVAFTASDICGNQVSATASFSIIDNTPPTIVTPASDDGSECNNSAVNAWLADNGGARASDQCSAVTFTNNFIAFNGGCIETAFVTFTATDACGLASDTSATYSITDTQPPIISPQASSLNVPCDNDTGNELSNWLNTQGGADATDACQDDSTLVWTNDFASAVVGCDFVDVTFTVSDACGNTRSTTARFTSVDNDAPTFNPEAQDLTVECDGNGNVSDFNTWVSTRAGSVPFDTCALSFTFSNNAPNQGPSSCSSVTVIFSVEDECGNTGTTSATYTVDDTIAPSFTTLPSDRSVECDGSDNSSDRNDWITSNAGASAIDVCASVVGFTQSFVDTTGDSCLNIDTYEFRASDQCGNSASQTASYTIHDFTAPEFTVEPQDLSVECDGNGNVGQITSWANDNGGARASDLCQGAVQITNDFNGNGIFTCTSSLVTYTVSDGCGNVAIRSASVTVTDTTSPVFNFFPDDITVPCDADTSTDVLGFATATDVCAGDLFVSFTESQVQEPNVGDCPGDIILTRTFSASDECGNFITRDQIVTVVIARASGPCDPVGCECDGCCPPAAASDCLAVDCQAVQCNASPCEATTCNCGVESKSLTHEQQHSIDELPQCKPVYIYVNDDDDTVKDVDTTTIAKQRMFVSNEPLHESVLQSKTSGSSILSFSFVLLVLSALLFI